MATKPLTKLRNPATRFNPTAQAIIGSAVIAVILATLVTGNPFRAVQLAYLDYSHTPAAGAPQADPAPGGAAPQRPHPPPPRRGGAYAPPGADQGRGHPAFGERAEAACQHPLRV